MRSQFLLLLALMLPMMSLASCAPPASKKTYCIQKKDETGAWVDTGWKVTIDPGSGVKKYDITDTSGNTYSGSYTSNPDYGRYDSSGGSGIGGLDMSGDATPQADGTVNFNASGLGWTGLPDSPSGNPASGNVKLVDC